MCCCYSKYLCASFSCFSVHFKRLGSDGQSEKSVLEDEDQSDQGEFFKHFLVINEILYSKAVWILFYLQSPYQQEFHYSLTLKISICAVSSLQMNKYYTLSLKIKLVIVY